MPEWKRAAKQLEKNDPPVCFGQVNAMKISESMSNKYEIDGYPLFVQVVDGTLHQFHRRVPPTAQTLTSWVGNTYKQDHVLADEQALEVFSHDFLQSSARVVLGIYQ